MTTFAVVPVKHLNESKTRLVSALTLENRKRLTLAMLEDVLNAVKCSIVRETIVVGSDPRVCEFAAVAGVTYKEEDRTGLNRAITSSIEWCIKSGANAVLVLPADIPLLSSTDINRIIEIAGKANSTVVISPSHNGGTNALYLRPPNVIEVSYGPGSFKRHIIRSRTIGARLKVYYSRSVAFDIDSQKDLQRLLGTENFSHSGHFVAGVLGRKSVD
jgi:2-phospho-L-lactate guanylyltransferase